MATTTQNHKTFVETINVDKIARDLVATWDLDHAQTDATLLNPQAILAALHEADARFPEAEPDMGIGKTGTDLDRTHAGHRVAFATRSDGYGIALEVMHNSEIVEQGWRYWVTGWTLSGGLSDPVTARWTEDADPVDSVAELLYTLIDWADADHDEQLIDEL